MRMALAFLIVKVLVQPAGSLWAIRDILLVFNGKATWNASTLFPKYNAHSLDAVADHAWDDDTGLYVWILCFRFGGLGVTVLIVVLITRGSTTLFLYWWISCFCIGNISVMVWMMMLIVNRRGLVGAVPMMRRGHETDCTHLVPNRAHRASR